MRHVTFCVAGFALLALAGLLAPLPSGAGFLCLLFSVPCFVIALWAPKGAK